MKYFQHMVIFNKGTIDITDPCYDKDVWCRLSCNIIPGTYVAQTYLNKDKRISRIRITHKDYIKGWGSQPFILYGEIGVDAGLAGFFEDKPDYTDDDWNKICKFLPFDKEVSQTCKITDPLLCNGVLCSTGWGDGEYSVYKKINSNSEIFCLEIKFI